MQACLAGQALLFSAEDLNRNTHPTPGGGDFRFRLLFYFHSPYSL